MTRITRKCGLREENCCIGFGQFDQEIRLDYAKFTVDVFAISIVFDLWDALNIWDILQFFVG